MLLREIMGSIVRQSRGDATEIVSRETISEQRLGGRRTAPAREHRRWRQRNEGYEASE